MTRATQLCVTVLVLGLSTLPAIAEDYIPKPGEFPPSGTGHYLAGELVQIDPINRRGGQRLDGDLVDDRYDKAQPQQFAMLPYGMIYYHGAPAELRDIPIGTHLHGTFYLPPPGEEKTLPPNAGPPQYASKYNHALLIEDDFSFYQRHGQAWKILSAKDRALKVIPVGTPAKMDWKVSRSFGCTTAYGSGKGERWLAVKRWKRIRSFSSISPGVPNGETAISE